jgi:protocatechuate 3,4-dioxygenase beta subunit
MPSHETSTQWRVWLRLTVWTALAALIIGVGVLTSHRTMAQSVICAGNSSIPLSPTQLTLTRTGAVTYEISLCTTPFAPVQVGVLPDPAGKVIIAPAVLTFTTPVSQTVALTIDPSVPLTEAFTVLLRHTVASADPAYNWGTTNTPSVVATYLIGNVTGVVFDDRNGNLAYDAGEPPLAGVTVALASGATTVTAADGRYWFTGLPPGDDFVNLTTPAGYNSVLPGVQPVHIDVGVTTIVDYPLIEQGVIQGVVFDDVNGNGRQDTGEPGLPGVMVARSDGPFTTTDATGAYRFTGVTPGSYTLAATAPAGYVASGARTRTVSLNAGGAAVANFAFQTQGVIQGVVFEDRNGNALQDVGEGGVAGVTITRSGGGAEITDANGVYRFTGVAAGGYTLALTPPAGYVVDGDATRTVYVGSGGAAQANFALWTQSAIQGVVFEDANGNHTQDIGEQGVAGVTITSSSGVSTTTDGNGAYQFASTPPGHYTIAMIVPSGYVASGLTEHFVYLSSSGAVQANFGVHAQGTIQGAVYEDVNGNGLQDNGEPGLGNVPVSVNGVGTVVTAIGGGYRFSNVTPGLYTVDVATAPGFAPMQATTRQVYLPSQGAVIASFGFRALGVIDGVVFFDRNGNGALDNHEQGLAGVPVALVNMDATALAADANAVITITTSTNAHGAYRFDLLPAGVYRVYAAAPAGYINLAAAAIEVELTAATSGFAHFPLQAANTIFGAVFVDLNGNDLREPDEPGVPDAPITVQSATATLATTTTLRGEYFFANVAAGVYTVTLGAVPGFLPIVPTTTHLALAANASAAAFFAVLPDGAVVGRAEPGSEITLTPLPTILEGAAVRTTRVNSRGYYWFLDVTPGAYEVRITLPLGFTAVQEIFAVDFVGGVARVDFDVLVDGVIQGVVFEDLDANQIRDVIELGVGGQTVRLLSGGTVLTETVTTAGGEYRFSNLPAAAYTLEAISTRFAQIAELAVTLTITQPGANLDIGLGRLHAITGRAYLDTLSAQAIGAATPGLANVPITLSGATGDSMASDVRGFYRFDLLPDGVYTVTVNAPAGFQPTTPATQYVMLSSVVPGHGINFGLRLYEAPTPVQGVHLPFVTNGRASFYSTNFSQGAGGEWSKQTVSSTPTGEPFLGEFSNETVALHLTGLPTHHRVTAVFDLYVIRSWDGNLFAYGPDAYQVRVEQRPIFDATFSNWVQFSQHYPTLSAPARSSAMAINGLGYMFGNIPQDTTYRLTLIFEHSATTLMLDFAAAGLQAITDESWGIDNVTIYLD